MKMVEFAISNFHNIVDTLSTKELFIQDLFNLESELIEAAKVFEETGTLKGVNVVIYFNSDATPVLSGIYSNDMPIECLQLMIDEELDCNSMYFEPAAKFMNDLENVFGFSEIEDHELFMKYVKLLAKIQAKADEHVKEVKRFVELAVMLYLKSYYLSNLDATITEFSNLVSKFEALGYFENVEVSVQRNSEGKMVYVGVRSTDTNIDLVREIKNLNLKRQEDVEVAATNVKVSKFFKMIEEKCKYDETLIGTVSLAFPVLAQLVDSPMR